MELFHIYCGLAGGRVFSHVFADQGGATIKPIEFSFAMTAVSSQ